MPDHCCYLCGYICDCGAESYLDCQECEECFLEGYDTELEYEEEQDG